MPIPVVCPSCHKSFHVSEKFAGKSGPCPKCKATIQVPAKPVAVEVHAPANFASGGRTTTGKLATKPIARTDAKLQPVMAAIIAAAALVVLLATWVGGHFGLFDTTTWRGCFVAPLALLVISPLLVIAAYTFLRDDELEPYRGRGLYIRAAACALGYVILWGMFNYVVGNQIFPTDELWSWIIIAPAFLIIGGLAAMAALDLEFGNAFFHYAFYVLVTIMLRWVAGAGWIWDVPKGS
jgi:hypothetical protein